MAYQRHLMSLRSIDEEGLTAATMFTRPLARIWAVIGQHLDGDIVSLVSSQHLVRLPARHTITAI